MLHIKNWKTQHDWHQNVVCKWYLKWREMFHYYLQYVDGALADSWLCLQIFCQVGSYDVIRNKRLYSDVDQTRCIEKCLNTWNIVSDDPFESNIWIKRVAFVDVQRIHIRRQRWRRTTTTTETSYTTTSCTTSSWAYQQREHATLPWTLSMCSLAGGGENALAPGIHCKRSKFTTCWRQWASGDRHRTTKLYIYVDGDEQPPRPATTTTRSTTSSRRTSSDSTSHHHGHFPSDSWKHC